MKKLLFAILLLISFTSFAQTVNVPKTQHFTDGIIVDSFLYIPTGCGVPTDSTFLHDKSGTKKAAKYYDSCGHAGYVWDPSLKIWKLESADSTVFSTRNWSLNNFIQVQTQSPTASLSGGYSYERHASGTFTASLGWSAGRQAAGTNILATNPLSSIIVAGVSQTFSQPAAGSSVSGSQSVTVTYNSNTTFTDTVKTTDGKNAIGYTYFSVYDKRFVGWAATSTPTNSEILAAVYQDNYGGTVPLSTVLAQLGSDKYLFIVYTATINTIAINGFPSTAAFTLDSSKTFTNASGGTFTGYISVSINPFGSVGTTTLNVN